MKEHMLAAGCPEDVYASAASSRVNWLQLLLLAARLGPSIWAMIQTDLAQGKNWFDIIQDLLKIVEGASGAVAAQMATLRKV